MPAVLDRFEVTLPRTNSDLSVGDLESGERTPILGGGNPNAAGKSREEAHDKLVNLAINLNMALNIVLLGGKIVAVLASDSKSLLASAVDSAME